jgi:hypothetical protein
LIRPLNAPEPGCRPGTTAVGATYPKKGRHSKNRDLPADPKCLRHTAEFGVPSVVLSAVVSTSIFAAIGTSLSQLATLAAGVVALAASVTTTLVTFLDYNSSARDH